jgi:hypothetical protein
MVAASSSSPSLGGTILIGGHGVGVYVLSKIARWREKRRCTAAAVAASSSLQETRPTGQAPWALLVSRVQATALLTIGRRKEGREAMEGGQRGLLRGDEAASRFTQEGGARGQESAVRQG